MKTANYPGPLHVSLLPLGHAYDFEYYKKRLADPALLASSVAVRVFRTPLLAIPTGGRRRGGCHPVTSIHMGRAVRDLLQERPGFPDLRLRRCLSLETSHLIEWGEVAPETGARARGRFYGYSDQAIADFIGLRARLIGLPLSSSHEPHSLFGQPSPLPRGSAGPAEEGLISPSQQSERKSNTCASTSPIAPPPMHPIARRPEQSRETKRLAGPGCATAFSSGTTPASCCRTGRSSLRAAPPCRPGPQHDRYRQSPGSVHHRP